MNQALATAVDDLPVVVATVVPMGEVLQRHFL